LLKNVRVLNDSRFGFPHVKTLRKVFQPGDVLWNGCCTPQACREVQLGVMNQMLILHSGCLLSQIMNFQQKPAAVFLPLPYLQIAKHVATALQALVCVKSEVQIAWLFLYTVCLLYT
jgi:hypothetical protein